MDLVDDEDLVAVADGRDVQAGNHHLADVVDAGVARCIDLEDVDVAALRDLDAGVALTARIGRRTLHAAQRARQDARRRRLAAAARPGQDKRMRHSSARQRVAKRTRDGLLPYHIVELLRTPLTGQNLVSHESTPNCATPNLQDALAYWELGVGSC